MSDFGFHGIICVLDRLFDEAPDIVAAKEYDYELASALLLDRDILKIASRSTKKTLLQILERESQREEGHRIAMDVLQSNGYRWPDYERLVAYLDSLLKGLSDSYLLHLPTASGKRTGTFYSTQGGMT